MDDDGKGVQGARGLVPKRHLTHKPWRVVSDFVNNCSFQPSDCLGKHSPHYRAETCWTQD